MMPGSVTNVTNKQTHTHTAVCLSRLAFQNERSVAVYVRLCAIKHYVSKCDTCTPLCIVRVFIGLQVYTEVWFRAAVFWGTALRVGQLTHPAATLLDDDSRNAALKLH
jgi:hypothetical protein